MSSALTLYLSAACFTLAAGCNRPSPPQQADSRCIRDEGRLQREGPKMLPGLLKSANSTEWLPAGGRFTYSSKEGRVLDIARILEQELACCSTLDFKLSTSSGEPVVLEVSGQEGAREMLVELMEHSGNGSDSAPASSDASTPD